MGDALLHSVGGRACVDDVCQRLSHVGHGGACVPHDREIARRRAALCASRHDALQVTDGSQRGGKRFASRLVAYDRLHAGSSVRDRRRIDQRLLQPRSQKP